MDPLRIRQEIKRTTTLAAQISRGTHTHTHTHGFTIQRKCNMETKRQEAHGARKRMEKTVPNLLMEIVVNEERARLLNAQGDAAQAADSIKESPI
jgi:hypothetical protein